MPWRAVGSSPITLSDAAAEAILHRRHVEKGSRATTSSMAMAR
jgi:hypothetical protein